MLWVGGPISHFERLSMVSFLKKNYSVFVYSYDEKLKVPVGVTVLPAATVIDIQETFADGRIPRPYALFSDLFRYRLLQTLDTTWVDCDVILLQDSLPENEFLFGHQGDSLVNSAVLRAPRRSELIEQLVSHSFSSDLKNWSWGDTGPGLLTDLINKLGHEALALPANALYPIRFEDAWMLFDPKSKPKVLDTIRGASTLHVWNEMIALGNPNFRKELPPKNSFMSDMLIDLGIETADLPIMNEKKVRAEVRRTNSPLRKIKRLILNW